MEFLQSCYPYDHNDIPNPNEEVRGILGSCMPACSPWTGAGIDLRIWCGKSVSTGFREKPVKIEKNCSDFFTKFNF
jgi:hypothetical protein